MQINVLAVILVTVASMVIGFFWYSMSVFGKDWMKMTGLKMETIKKGPGMGYVLTTFGSIVMAIVFSYLADGLAIKTWVDGAVMGIMIWIGFVATSYLATYTFSMKPFKLYLIDSGYFLVMLIAAGAIIGAFR